MNKYGPTSGELVFDQGAEAIQWRKDGFSTNDAEVLNIHVKKKNESRHI